jgi:hypothetical protein
MNFNINFNIRHVIIISFFILLIGLIFYINPKTFYTKNLKNNINDNEKCLLDNEWSLEDEIRKFTDKQDLLLK